MDNIGPFVGQLASLASLGMVLLITRQFEKRVPAESEQSSVAVNTDWKLAAVNIGIGRLLSPVTTACGIMLVNAAGGGWFELRSDGWWFLLSITIVILAVDLLAYLVHRAQHKFTVLWAMHSLHHSADALSVITGARHFWFERILTTPVFWIVGIVVKIPPDIMTAVAILHFVLGDGLAHLNMRVSLGRLALCLNNPQYHRIHHSIEPQHKDKNFCKMLPLFDVIFGTAWKPGKDEFPKTGLESREKPAGIRDGIIWPARQWVGRVPQ